MINVDTFVNVALFNVNNQEHIVETYHATLAKREKILNQLEVVKGAVAKLKLLKKLEVIDRKFAEKESEHLNTFFLATEEVNKAQEKYDEEMEAIENGEDLDYGDASIIEEEVEEEKIAVYFKGDKPKNGRKIKLQVKIGSYDLIKHRLSSGSHKLYYGNVVSEGKLKGETIVLQGKSLFMKVGDMYDVWGSFLNYEGENVLEGTKVLKDTNYSNEMEATDEEFLKMVKYRYIAKMNENGFLEVVATSWKAEYADGSFYGKNNFAGDRKTQTEERLAKCMDYIGSKYGEKICRKAEKLMTVLDHEVIDMRDHFANEAKLKEANDMVQAVMSDLKKSDQAKAELAKMSKEELWDMVPEQFHFKVSKEWSEKTIKRQERYAIIEDGKKLNIGWLNKLIEEAIKFEEYTKYADNWVDAKKIRYEKLIEKYSPMPNKDMAPVVAKAVNAAVEYGITYRPTIRKDLEHHLSGWWNDKEASKAIFVAAMAKMDLRYQRWIEECSGVEDNRLDEGKTHSQSRWGKELLDYVWNSGRDKEIWNPQVGSSADKARELLK